MDELRQWFASHGDGGLSPENDDIVQSMQASLAVTSEALQMLLGPAAIKTTAKKVKKVKKVKKEQTTTAKELPSAPAKEKPPTADAPESEAADEPEALTSGDLGPVAKVDADARLILENTDLRPLLQEFKGVRELTVLTKEQLQSFLAKQGIEFGKNETRRLHDKVLRWIEGTPAGRVLVIKISGLYGKPEAYSSYQPKETVIPDPTEAD